MTLHDILTTAQYTQQISVYLQNDYDQNLLIGRGTRPKMLDEKEVGTAVFDHLMDRVVLWIAKKDRLLVFIEDEKHEIPFEEQLSDSDEWGETPDKRPWRYSIETEEYTDAFIQVVSA